MLESLFRNAIPAVDVRAVHLDLKGLPPTPARLRELLRVLAAARCNAVVVEWEDTFPWTVDERFRCETAYSPAEVQEFAATAASLGIEIIPLVQCLGHMETPLSIADYAHLREVPSRSDVLNPLAPGARELVEGMVLDVLRLLPGLRRFHLGGDEAWSFGSHPDTKAFIAAHGRGALYLQHVEPLLALLGRHGIRPLLWHDMMRQWDDAALRRLAPCCDLVAWGYGGHPGRMREHCNRDILRRFRDQGIVLWGGTAYKGADGQDADLPNLARREENACGWMELAREFDLRGIIATAWSRYATQTVQNEPIDGALDALLHVAVIMHDGVPAAGGSGACVAALAEIGEAARFAACRDALRQLADARRNAWPCAARLRENMVTAVDDHRRRGSGQCVRMLERLRTALHACESAAAAVRATEGELVPALWIERYLSERVTPLRDELAMLEPAVRALEPAAYAAATPTPAKTPTACTLADRECVPCRGGVPPLAGAELDALFAELGNEWQLVAAHHLRKRYTFRNFREALAFTNRVGELAETVGHHPDLEVAWGNVVLTVWTHKIDGLAAADFIFAAKADQLPR